MPDTWSVTQFADTLQSSSVAKLLGIGAIMFIVIGGLALLSHHYTLNGIKSRTVGDGQHGTARWATNKEIKNTYAHVLFNVNAWRKWLVESVQQQSPEQ